MQSHIERTCRVVESSASQASLSGSFSSIEKALFAAAELAAREDEPCIVCGLAPEEPARWARGTQPVPVAITTQALEEQDAEEVLFAPEPLAAEPVPQPLEPLEPIPPVHRELCEPDMIISADFRVATQPAPAKRNPLLVALGAVLMAVGVHYIFSSLGIRR